MSDKWQERISMLFLCTAFSGTVLVTLWALESLFTCEPCRTECPVPLVTEGELVDLIENQKEDIK